MSSEERTLYIAQGGKVVKASVPKRDLEPNQVRVKVHSVGINPIDWKTIDNNLADGAGQGNDFAGTIIEVGSEVKSFKVGDTVAGGVGGGDVDKKENGSFTDLLSVEENILFKFPHKLEEAKKDEIPTGLPRTFEQAASLGISADTNALAFEKHKQPGKDDWALIYGVTGSLGFVAAQYALNLGYNVIGVSGPHAEIVNQLEGIHWIDRHDNDWVKKAKLLSNNRIVFAYDTVGAGDAPNQVFSALSDEVAARAAFSSPGVGPDEKTLKSNAKASAEYPLYFHLFQPVKKFGPNAIPDDDHIIDRNGQVIKKANDFFAENKLKALNIQVLHGFDKINDGLELSRKGVRGTKVVVTFD